MSKLLLLSSLRRFSDLGLLLLRMLVGAFLIYGVLDNIVSSARMDEFTQFLAKAGLPVPALMARLSVWAQFGVGISFITGLLTRWAGIVCAVNFAVAIVMVDRFAGVRGAFPAACLMCIGIYLALRGSGRFGIDAMIEDHTA